MKNKYIFVLIVALLFSCNITPVFAYQIERPTALLSPHFEYGLFNFVSNLFSFSKTSLLASVVSVTKVSGGKSGSLQQNVSSNSTGIIGNIKNSIFDRFAPIQKQAYYATTDKYASHKAYLSGTYSIKDFSKTSLAPSP